MTMAEARAARWPDLGPPAAPDGADASRRVADVLAWVHRALIDEREFVDALLAPLAPAAVHDALGVPTSDAASATDSAAACTPSLSCASSDDARSDACVPSGDAPAARDAVPPRDAVPAGAWATDVLAHSMAGCVPPLRARVEHAVSHERAPVELVRVHSVLASFDEALRASGAAPAPLADAVQELLELGAAALVHSLQSAARPLAALAGPSALASPAFEAAAALLDAVLPACAADAAAAGLYDIVGTHLVDAMRACVARAGGGAAAAPEVRASWLDVRRYLGATRGAAPSALDADVRQLTALCRLYRAVAPYDAMQASRDAVATELLDAAERVVVAETAELRRRTGLAHLDGTADVAAFRRAWAAHDAQAPPIVAALPGPVRDAVHRAACVRAAQTYVAVPDETPAADEVWAALGVARDDTTSVPHDVLDALREAPHA